MTQVLPYPPDSGPKVKTWNLLKYLSNFHEITLASFVRGDQSKEINHLKSYCTGGIYTTPMDRTNLSEIYAISKSIRNNKPWLIERDSRKAMQMMVDQLVSKYSFDIIHVDQLNMAQYAIGVKKVKKVLDEHNALWLLYKRLWETMKPGLKKWIFGRDWQLMQSYEGKMCRIFDAVIAVSDQDKSALEEISKEYSKISVIPISIDTSEINPIKRNSLNKYIVHIGTMYWPPNIDGVRWFINEVFPIIRNSCSDINFDVIGARPPKDLLKLNHKDNGIRILGYINDPSKYLERAAVMVVPVRAGGGMRVKILNGLSQSLPIVSTKIGCEGIAVESGNHLLVADTPHDFAMATLSLLNDPERANQLGNNGRRLVEQLYDYRIVCSRIDKIYKSI